MKPIIIKTDRRYKDGNVKVTGRVVRGNPKTVELKRLVNIPELSIMLNPPIVVSRELGEKLAGLLR